MPNHPAPKKPGDPVSARDIAEAAGVSIGTVSMALNDNPVVAAKTREAIQDLAEKMGYRRSPAFAALGSRSRWAKAVRDGTPVALVYEARPDDMAFAGLPSLFAGMQVAGEKLGYRAEDFKLEYGADWQPLLKVLRSRGFAAVVVGQMLGLRALEFPHWSKFVAVALGQQTQPLPMPTVRFSRHLSTRQAVIKAWEKGYRRIGFLEGIHDRFTATEDFARHGGFVAGMREVGVGFADLIPPLEHPIRRVPKGKFRSWVRKHRPDAIISTTGWLIYKTLQEWGYAIPGDFGFIGLLGADETTIAHPEESLSELGGEAMRQVDHMLRHGDYGLHQNPRHIIVSSFWKDGPSLP